MTAGTPTEFNTAADPQLHTFMVQRLALAIRRADANPGAATHAVESAIRRAAHVPGSQDVVNAYGNTDEGDQSAGLVRSGPAASDYVGRVEARKMMLAWRLAGRHMTRRPNLDLRWTRVCFCGQSTDAGRVDNSAVIGLPLLTGSEEGRGPLDDQTHGPFEGRMAPA